MRACALCRKSRYLSNGVHRSDTLFGTRAFDNALCINVPRGKKIEKKSTVIPPGIEPGTLSVLDSRDNRYTTESLCQGVCLNTVLFVVSFRADG